MRTNEEYCTCEKPDLIECQTGSLYVWGGELIDNIEIEVYCLICGKPPKEPDRLPLLEDVPF